MRRLAPLLLALSLLVSAGALVPAQAQAQVQCPASCPGSCDPKTGACVSTTTGTPSTGAGTPNTAALKGYSDSIIGIINGTLVPLLVAVAFIVFLYGVFKYFILGGTDPESRKEGTQLVLWGVVGFVIIFSVWGLVNLLMGTLNLSAGSLAPTPPKL